MLVSSREEAHLQTEQQDRHMKVKWLAEQSLRFLQLEEALGRAPGMDEFGASGFEDRSAVLSPPDVEQAWRTYVGAVEAARETPTGRWLGPLNHLHRQLATRIYSAPTAGPKPGQAS